MTAEQGILLAIGIALFAYIGVALIKPEWF
jgi:K+-transporting ATPase KdpF subunit